MKNKLIQGAAKLYFSKNVNNNNTFDKNTPTECYLAGAQFVIDAQKKRNNCNLPELISYNQKRNDMDKYEKILKNVEKIFKVSGFYISIAGDPSVGINPASWEIRNDFYFDNQKELEEFRKEIKCLFEFHCGEDTSVITFEENKKQLDTEEQTIFDQHKVRYLIKDDGLFKQADSTASYSSSVGDGIHFEVPHWIDKNSNVGEDRVINSTTDEYWKILREEAGRLENEIRNEEYRLKDAKRNLKLIQNEFKHG